MHATALPRLPKSFWIIAVLGLLWNLLGLAMFFMQVTLSPEALAAMPAAQREIHGATPAWIDVTFGLTVVSGVVSGVLGAVGLLMRRRWAVVMFGVSLVALAVQLLGAYLVTPAGAASGAAGLGLPVLLIVIAFALLAYACNVASRGWLA